MIKSLSVSNFNLGHLGSNRVIFTKISRIQRVISDLSFKSFEEHPILIKLQPGANGANGVTAQNHANRALLLEPAKKLEHV